MLPISRQAWQTYDISQNGKHAKIAWPERKNEICTVRTTRNANCSVRYPSVCVSLLVTKFCFYIDRVHYLANCLRIRSSFFSLNVTRITRNRCLTALSKLSCTCKIKQKLTFHLFLELFLSFSLNMSTEFFALQDLFHFHLYEYVIASYSELFSQKRAR